MCLTSTKGESMEAGGWFAQKVIIALGSTVQPVAAAFPESVWKFARSLVSYL